MLWETNFGWNIETFILLSVSIGSIIGILIFLRRDWKRYGLLLLISSVVANTLCYLFVIFGFYFYPYRFFPNLTVMPIGTVTTAFSFLVFIAVTYSPKRWSWKIPFYWTIIHLGLIGETIILLYTDLITYQFKWDFWDSYTWWWIFLLVFEWIGGLIIPPEQRRPIDEDALRFGKLGWGIIHFVLIISIFLGGYYLGLQM